MSEEIDKFVNSLYTEKTVYMTDEVNRRNMTEFMLAAKEAGFTDLQVEFLNEFVAKYPHSHEPDDIIGLDEVISEAVGDEDEEDEEEE